MAHHVLVLNGPTVSLHAVFAEAQRALAEHAQAGGVSLKVVTSNHVGVLLDAMVEHRAWYQSLIVNNGPGAPQAYALAEAVELLDKRAVEVAFEALPPMRGPSALEEVAEASFIGPDAYLEALRHLLEESAPPPQVHTPVPQREGTPKTLGRKRTAPSLEPSEAAHSKTIGRRQVGAPTTDGVVTRAQLRLKIADRLAGRLAPEALAAWAKERWQAVQMGAATEAGHRELIEETLMHLTVSRTTNDHTLISFMTKLGQ